MTYATKFASLFTLAIVLSLAASLHTMAAVETSTAVTPAAISSAATSQAGTDTIPVITITAKRLSAADKALF